MSPAIVWNCLGTFESANPFELRFALSRRRRGHFPAHFVKRKQVMLHTGVPGWGKKASSLARSQGGRHELSNRFYPFRRRITMASRPKPHATGKTKPGDV